MKKSPSDKRIRSDSTKTATITNRYQPSKLSFNILIAAMSTAHSNTRIL